MRMKEELIVRRMLDSRCGHTREKKKRAAKPKVQSCVYERLDIGGAERGQDNKQGSMEEYDHQF